MFNQTIFLFVELMLVGWILSVDLRGIQFGRLD